jgi:tetratricopeptide (TPR) repeat protein
LSGVKHEYQGWNNCGPTTLEMYLSFYGRNDTQKEIAAFTKPDWNDKNVSPNELVSYTNKTGLHVIVRENGTLERLKQLLSNGLPVMTENGYLTPSGKEGWMGHYKLLTGYDDKQFTVMDSYEGPNQKVAFDAMDADWRAFNRLYMIVYPSDNEPTVRAILGSEFDDTTMYTNAATHARTEIAANPKDPFAYLNLGTSLNGLQQYKDAAAAFDQARVLGLPWRMTWYQFGPYVAYLQTGRYGEVIALADATLNVVDDLEESHYYKGMALLALGRSKEARSEFQAALHYNPNYQDAQQALQATSTTP